MTVYEKTVKLRTFNETVQDRALNVWIIVVGFLIAAIRFAFHVWAFVQPLPLPSTLENIVYVVGVYGGILAIACIIGGVAWIVVFYVTVSIVEPILERRGMTEVVPNMDFAQFIGIVSCASLSLGFILTFRDNLAWTGFFILLGGGFWGFLADVLRAMGDAEAQKYGLI